MAWLAGLLLKWGGETIVKLAVEVYKQWAHDASIRDAERSKMALAASELARRALQWKEAHPLPPAGADPLAGFRVRDGAPGIEPVPPDDPAASEPGRPA